MADNKRYLEIAHWIGDYPTFYADLAGEAIKALVKENEELRKNG